LDEKVLDDYLDIFITLLRSDYTVKSEAKEETQEERSGVNTKSVKKPIETKQAIKKSKSFWTFAILFLLFLIIINPLLMMFNDDRVYRKNSIVAEEIAGQIGV
jgi:hypothetical protein